MLFTCLALTAIAQSYNQYLNLMQAIAENQLNAAVEEFRSMGVEIDGSQSVPFSRSLKDFACGKFEGDAKLQCLEGTLEDNWKALISRNGDDLTEEDMKMTEENAYFLERGERQVESEVYQGPVYCYDPRNPAQVFRHSKFLQSTAPENQPMVSISKHLYAGSQLFTSASTDHAGILFTVSSKLYEGLNDRNGYLWVNKITGRVVDCPFEDRSINVALTRHNDFYRIKLIPEYYGLATGAENVGRPFRREKQVTILGFQPTHVRYNIADVSWLKSQNRHYRRNPVDDMTDVEIVESEESEEVPGDITLFTTEWKSLVSDDVDVPFPPADGDVWERVDDLFFEWTTIKMPEGFFDNLPVNEEEEESH